MKKNTKNSRKAFTLVELIVVLVILAVLAAMLVPALIGYIKRARDEKNIELAYTLRTASQAILTEMYGRGESPAVDHRGIDYRNATEGSYSWSNGYTARIYDLAGLQKKPEVFMIQCGSYKEYKETEYEYRAYTVYRVFFQYDKNSELYIIDSEGVHEANDPSFNLYWGQNTDIDGEKINTVVYGAPANNPNGILSAIKNHSYNL